MTGTLVDKIWDRHVVHSGGGAGPDLLYVDMHLLHEISSPQAFEGLRVAGRTVRRPDLTLAVEDHTVPTDGLGLLNADSASRAQVEALRSGCADFGVPLESVGDDGQGIVHVIGPELGLTQPGMTLVCSDSHTSTHGALGAFAVGVGTSETEHILVTQTLWLQRPRTLAVNIEGRLRPGVTAKDLILAVIARLGAGGGAGYAIEYRGEAIEALSMDGRMTVCNMSIEAGARAGLIAPDEKTFAYLRGRKHAPAPEQWDAAVAEWSALASAPDARFDEQITIDAAELAPFVTWGTSPAQSVQLTGTVPDPEAITDPAQRAAAVRALEYMDLTAGTRLRDVPVDVVFLGSCTNGRLDDLRSAAEVLRGRRVRDGLRMLVVPGSLSVRRQAEEEGLDEVFLAAGAEWRTAGCSMCVGMNDDRLLQGQRCASTSNRNFEGRQGAGGRTHLVSPAVAAATAVRGAFTAPADLS